MTTTPTFVIGNPDAGEWLASFHHCGRVATFTNDKASAKRFTCPKSGREEAAAAAVEEIPPVMEGPARLITASRPLVRNATRQLCLFDG
jgi:hypothetical protein